MRPDLVSREDDAGRDQRERERSRQCPRGDSAPERRPSCVRVLSRSRRASCRRLEVDELLRLAARPELIRVNGGRRWILSDVSAVARFLRTRLLAPSLAQPLDAVLRDPLRVREPDDLAWFAPVSAAFGSWQLGAFGPARVSYT